MTVPKTAADFALDGNVALGHSRHFERGARIRLAVDARQLALRLVFKSYDDLVDHFCEAWNRLVDQPWRIMSIALCQWAHGFRSIGLGLRAFGEHGPV